MKNLFYRPNWMPTEHQALLWVVALPPKYRIETVHKLMPLFREKVEMLLVQAEKRRRDQLLQNHLNILPLPVEEQLDRIMNHGSMMAQHTDLLRRVDQGQSVQVLERFTPQEIQKIYQLTNLESLISVLSETEF